MGHYRPPSNPILDAVLVLTGAGLSVLGFLAVLDTWPVRGLGILCIVFGVFLALLPVLIRRWFYRRKPETQDESRRAVTKST